MLLLELLLLELLLLEVLLLGLLLLEQCRTQRRFHGDSGVLALFCEPESPESSPRIFLSGLYVPHSQWG